jgi:hypothetical protein
MHRYFKNMPLLGRAMSAGQMKSSEENIAWIQEVETIVSQAAEKVKNAGFPSEKINARGQLTVYQRLDYLLDPATWCPLHTLYNPEDNEEGTTNVVDGLGKISGRWSAIIGFDNKVLAGAWLPGQADNILRVTDLSKRLNIPQGGRYAFLPTRRTGASGHPDSGRDLRNQSSGRRLSEYQSHRPFRPQGLQYGSGRRRHSQRHVSKRLLR